MQEVGKGCCIDFVGIIGQHIVNVIDRQEFGQSAHDGVERRLVIANGK